MPREPYYETEAESLRYLKRAAGAEHASQPVEREVTADVVARACQRDPDAFALIYEAYVDRLYRHVSYRVPNKLVAEDVTGQVFLNAWRAIDRYRPEKDRPILAWLLTIANNLVTDYYRRSRRQMLREVPLEDLDGGADPEKIQLRRHSQMAIRDSIARLKRDQQLVVTLRLIEQMEYPEIARILGKPESTVRVILFRALRALRAELLERDVRP
jgi:RNA polymerase sigma-70 factor (ECF subfamily)